MKTTVFVVMGNDYPNAVFSTEELAEAYCAAMKAKDKAEGRENRIYWRDYDFEIDAKVEAAK